MGSPPSISVELAVDPYLVRVLNKAISAPQISTPPLTYPFCLTNYDDRFVVFMSKLDIDLARTMHAEQAFEYVRPLQLGEAVRVTLQAGGQYQKKNGALTFTPISGDIRAFSGELISRQEIVLVTLARADNTKATA